MTLKQPHLDDQMEDCDNIAVTFRKVKQASKCFTSIYMYIALRTLTLGAPGTALMVIRVQESGTTAGHV